MYHGLVKVLPRAGRSFTRPWYNYYQAVVMLLEGPHEYFISQ